MLPQDAYKREWAKRLETELLEYQVILPETDEEILSAIVDADAVIRLGLPRGPPVGKETAMDTKPRCWSLPWLLLPSVDRTSGYDMQSARYLL